MYGSKKNKIDDMLNKINGFVWELCAVQDTFVYLVDEREKKYRLKRATGFFLDFNMAGNFKNYILNQIYETKKIVILDDFSLENFSIGTNTPKQISRLLILPLMCDDKLLGVVGTAFTKSGSPLEDKELSLLQQFTDLSGLVLGKILSEYLFRAVIRNQKKEIKSIEQIEGKYAQMFYMSPDAIGLINLDGTFVEVNHSFTLITGFSKEEAVGKTLKDLGIWFNIGDRKKIIKLLYCSDEIEKIEVPICKKDGEIVHTQILARRVTLNQKQYYIVVGRDISKQVAAKAECIQQDDTIKHMAYFDQLTDIPNRNNLYEKLAKELGQAKIGKTSGVVFSIDVDGLKTINDAYGHHFGDKVLITVSTRIREAVGEKVFVARTGGDEFVVALQGKYTNGQIDIIAEKISRSVSKKQQYLGMSLHTTVSMGITHYPEDGDTVEAIIKKAEDARYEAKKNGRNCWEFYNKEMQIEAYNSTRMIEGLRYAIERGELFLVYQPQVFLPQRIVGGMEALLRWNSPKYGNVSPSVFIPLAEESGIINSIGKWVLTEACCFAGRLAQKGHGNVRVAVNISARQVATDDFVDIILCAAKAANIKPQQLEIEITESSLMVSLDDAIYKLEQLKAKGFNIALDDFGTGFSSLTYLRRLPIKTLKIDKSFIDLIETDTLGAGMVGAIINMAKTINMNVVAEGVETKKQLDYLLKKNCDYIQGYLFSKPLEEDKVYKFLENFKG
ncbi:MAG: EAL domain-containing protein [Acidaminococcaceae bacterium]|nr:EAL domain-containing protein [Acidaminococcaceae bacterium]